MGIAVKLLKMTKKAYKLGMYGADYVWILHEIVGEPWWHKTTHECNQKQLQEVSENLLIVSSHNSIVSNEISYSGLVSYDVLATLKSLLTISHITYYPSILDKFYLFSLPFNNPIEIKMLDFPLFAHLT